jgi:hypothetical protein
MIVPYRPLYAGICTRNIENQMNLTEHMCTLHTSAKRVFSTSL